MKASLVARRPAPSLTPTVTTAEATLACQSFLRSLLASSLVLPEDWEKLPSMVRDRISSTTERSSLLSGLVDYRLLTEYQAARIESGTTFGLILGNYRVLERVGAGGMGIVFKAEHVDLRRLVAIKVLPLSGDQDERLLLRFLTEARVLAQLQHPNIVTAIDAGKLSGGGLDSPGLRYFVMELVAGQDLEEYVLANGPLSPAKACDLAYQVAAALAEAHKHDLVHRDIKPPNIRVTPEGQAKLLDFGLTRHLACRMTEPGTMLGTIDFVAPEQVQDAGSVDIRADIYGLGGTLFWCLTGRTPFPPRDSLAQQLTCRLTKPPPSVRSVRPEIPAELDALVARMMALNPADRHPTPQAVMQALLPFLRPDLRDHILPVGDATAIDRRALGNGPGPTAVKRILLADDEDPIRAFCRYALKDDGLEYAEASNGVHALELLRAQPYDLVLLDVNMPHLSGAEVCRRLRDDPPTPHLKIIMLSGGLSSDEMSRMLLAGADDFLSKPLSVVQLQSRVKAALRLKESQDQADLLHRHILAINQELEHTLTMRDTDLVHVRSALVRALGRLVACRESESAGHLYRLERYCRTLAEEAAKLPAFAQLIGPEFIDLLACCAPLHDIGKVGLPDHILLKPGKLDSDERILMQAHTVMGAETLKEVAQQHGSAVAFLQMAMDITRHHHERYDGRGYPDRLAGAAIPLAARIVAVGDVYDALRSRRSYKPALSHAAALQVMLHVSAGHFDPDLLRAFERCAPQFERIFRELPD